MTPNRQHRPTTECIWYVLATIAGEPGKTADPQATAQQNRDFWNAFMQSCLDPCSGVKDAKGRTVELPAWTEDHVNVAIEALDNRGFAGFHLPNPRDRIDFSYLDFPEHTSFDGFVFAGPTSFKGAGFRAQSQCFDGAVFVQSVTFEDAEFHGEFSGRGMSIYELGEFSRARFGSDVWLVDSHCRGISRFNGATFERQARFERCTFGDAVFFRESEFHDLANFNGVEIRGSCVFLHAKFNEYVPAFMDAMLPEYTLWHGAKWPKVPKSTNDALTQAQFYQRLARIMNGLEKFDEQSMFLRQEMRARRRIYGWFPVGSLNLVYELICDYGYGLGRVAAWWAAHMLLGGVALCISKSIASMDQGATWPPISESFASFGSAMLLSFSNAHGFLNLNDKFFASVQAAWESVPFYAAIGAFQTIAGVILLFFLLLTIRNRFRMR